MRYLYQRIVTSLVYYLLKIIVMRSRAKPINFICKQEHFEILKYSFSVALLNIEVLYNPHKAHKYVSFPRTTAKRRCAFVRVCHNPLVALSPDIVLTTIVLRLRCDPIATHNDLQSFYKSHFK